MRGSAYEGVAKNKTCAKKNEINYFSVWTSTLQRLAFIIILDFLDPVSSICINFSFETLEFVDL